MLSESDCTRMQGNDFRLKVESKTVMAQYKDVPGGISMLKIRRSRDRLIFNMRIPIPGKDGLYIERGPGFEPRCGRSFTNRLSCPGNIGQDSSSL